MSLTQEQINTNNTNEWLQFIEFIKRKYGANSSEYIRINHFADRANNESVAKYYNRVGSTNIPRDSKLDTLLKNGDFIDFLELDNPISITNFTEIYNETDQLIKSHNDPNSSDGVYIKCNPVNDNGDTIKALPPSAGATKVNSMFDGVASLFNPDVIYNNVGLLVFICILVLALIVFIVRMLVTYAKFNITSSTVFALGNRIWKKT